MPQLGAPGIESFRDAITTFPNGHIIAALTPLFDLRSQLVAIPSFKTRGGFDDVTKQYLQQQLAACDKIRRAVTYNREGQDIGQLVKEATDVKVKIGGKAKPFSGDQVQTGSRGMFTLPWAVDGTDPNIPMLGDFDFRNKNALLLVNAIDQAIVAWTRMESRFRTRYITVMDSMRIYGMYVEIWEYLEMFAGDDNLVDIAQGVLPTEEPRGPDNAPNLRSQTSGAGEITSAMDTAGGTTTP